METLFIHLGKILLATWLSKQMSVMMRLNCNHYSHIGWLKEMERGEVTGWVGGRGEEKRRQTDRVRVREKEKTQKLERNSD